MEATPLAEIGPGETVEIRRVTAGDPDPAGTVSLMHALAAGGADIIELGVPFSDPMADGPVIQSSSQQALAQGMTFEGALALITEAKLSIPVVLFSYLNPIVAAGPDALQRARAAGARSFATCPLRSAAASACTSGHRCKNRA